MPFPTKKLSFRSPYESSPKRQKIDKKDIEQEQFDALNQKIDAIVQNLEVDEILESLSATIDAQFSSMPSSSSPSNVTATVANNNSISVNDSSAPRGNGRQQIEPDRDELIIDEEGLITNVTLSQTHNPYLMWVGKEMMISYRARLEAKRQLEIEDMEIDRRLQLAKLNSAQNVAELRKLAQHYSQLTPEDLRKSKSDKKPTKRVRVLLMPIESKDPAEDLLFAVTSVYTRETNKEKKSIFAEYRKLMKEEEKEGKAK